MTSATRSPAWGIDGQSLVVIGKMLGHSQPATTARYAHLADDPVKAASDAVGTSCRSNGQPEWWCGHGSDKFTLDTSGITSTPAVCCGEPRLGFEA